MHRKPITIGKYTLPQLRKLLVAGAGIAVILLTSLADQLADVGVPAAVVLVFQFVIAAVTLIRTFLVENAPVLDAVGGKTLTEGQSDALWIDYAHGLSRENIE